MTVARVITRSASPIVEQLELDGDVIVTVERMAAVMAQVESTGDPRQVAYELQRDGWLGKLRTRGAWEFLPGSRGGRYGSGDRFIEFRAQCAVDPAWGGVLAMESAASVLGLAQRIPEQEVVAVGAGKRFPKALARQWRHVRIDMPAEGIADVNGLRSWSSNGLLVGIAVRPSAYHDVAGLAQWIETAAEGFDEVIIKRLLDGSPAAVRQRAAYLLLLMGRQDSARWVLEDVPPQASAWFGLRQPGGRYEPLTKVNDTLLTPYLGVGGGA